MVVRARGRPGGWAGGPPPPPPPRLHPVDRDRLLVTAFLLEADVDEIAALDHLLGGLGEARLVAVDRRNLEKTGQGREERDGNQRRDGAGMCARPATYA